MIWRTAAGAAMVFMLAGLAETPAAAASITTESYVFDLADRGQDEQIDFDLFAPDLGALTAVTLEFYFRFQPVLSVINLGEDSLVLTGGRIAVDQVEVVGPDGTVVTPGHMEYSFPPQTIAPDQTGELNYFVGPLAAAAHLTVAVPVGQLGSYVGFGRYPGGLTFKVPSIASSGDVSGGLMDTVFVGGTALLGATGSITYEYTVPEPANFAVAGLGIALYFVRRVLVRSRSK